MFLCVFRNSWFTNVANHEKNSTTHDYIIYITKIFSTPGNYLVVLQAFRVKLRSPTLPPTIILQVKCKTDFEKTVYFMWPRGPNNNVRIKDKSEMDNYVCVFMRV